MFTVDTAVLLIAFILGVVVGNGLLKIWREFKK